MGNIIEALQKNKIPLALLPNEQQMFFMKVAKKEGSLLCLASDIKERWFTKEDIDWNLPCNWNSVYRLREDYKEEAGVEKKDVYFADGKLYFELIGDKFSEYVCDAPRYTDFIGFLYEDGLVFVDPRRYKCPMGDTNGCADIVDIERGEIKVLTPTHVLFRKA